MVFCAAGRRDAERAFAVKPIIARFSQGGNNTANWICDVLQNFGGAVKCAVNFPETTKKRKKRGTSHLIYTKRLLYSAFVQNQVEFLVDLPRENGKIIEYLVGTLPVLRRTAF